MNEKTEAHSKAIAGFLDFSKFKSELILKGGAALKFCYGSPRFTEGIDFDGTRRMLLELVDEFCKTFCFDFRIIENSDIVQSCLIDYGSVDKHLKVEVSFRNRAISDDDVSTIDGIRVYNIDAMLIDKALAFMSRDKLRDLYDLTFIFKTYNEELSDFTLSLIKKCLKVKGLEYFDYIARVDKSDELPINVLASDFLAMHEKLRINPGKLDRSLFEGKYIHGPE